MSDAIDRLKDWTIGADNSCPSYTAGNELFARDVEALLKAYEGLMADNSRHEAALRTLTHMGYYWNGGAFFHPPQSGDKNEGASITSPEVSERQ